MKLKEGLITHWTGQEQIMVSAGAVPFHGLVRSNATAAFIIDRLKQDTTLEALVDALAAEYDAPRERLAADAEQLVDQLRQAGLLDE